MKTTSAVAHEFNSSGLRLDASYYASSGVQAFQILEKWRKSNKRNRIEKLHEVCERNGYYIPSRFKRVYITDPTHGAPYITGGNILQVDPLEGSRFLSRKYTANWDELLFQERMTLLTCSGTIGNAVYVNKDFLSSVGSPDLIRIIADQNKILPGYLFVVLSSAIGKALIQQKTYGAVIPHIEAHHVKDLPIPRLESKVEEQIHNLIEHVSDLRVQANSLLQKTQERFYKEVLGFEKSRLQWKAGHVDAYAIGKAKFKTTNHRLDAFHYVGYTGEAEAYLPKTQPMGDLVEPYQPPMFKRPYTGESGIPFLSGIDLYDSYPKPHMYISRKMEKLNLYIVEAGTILVQNVGQRYGLFGRPTILPKHLDKSSVTQHMMRVHLKNKQDRGFIYIWLSIEIGRRLLLKESFGTSMGVLFERSFRQMPIPKCDDTLRYSFEKDVKRICEMRDKAIELENQAQDILAKTLQT